MIELYSGSLIPIVIACYHKSTSKCWQIIFSPGALAKMHTNLEENLEKSNFQEIYLDVHFTPSYKVTKTPRWNFFIQDGHDKPCAYCTTLHLRGMNGIRWVILACGMSSLNSWVTKHNCTMFVEVGHETLSDNQWGPSPMLHGVQGGEYADQGSVWTAFDPGKPLWGSLGKKGVVPSPSGALQHSIPLSIQNGTSIWSSSTQCKLLKLITYGLCGYLGGMMSWRFCNSSSG